VIAMPLVETLPVGPDTAQWPVWSTTARLVVIDAAALPAAREIVRGVLDAVDEAASRFRDDSEINQLYRAAGRPQQVSPLLAQLLQAALTAAERTDGDVDPTLGAALSDGYHRDFAALPADGPPVRVVRRAAADWRQVQLAGRRLTLPPGVWLDLGATAKAFTADRCAALVARWLRVGVLVALGGDIASASGRCTTSSTLAPAGRSSRYGAASPSRPRPVSRRTR